MAAASLQHKLEGAALLGGLRITYLYSLLLMVTMIVQGVTKLRYALQARREKKSYQRYADTRMLPLDRSVGNLLEWGVAFLALLWVALAVAGEQALLWGYVYLAARAVYPVLATRAGGVTSAGAREPILLSTVPGYIALIMLLVIAGRELV